MLLLTAFEYIPTYKMAEVAPLEELLQRCVHVAGGAHGVVQPHALGATACTALSRLSLRVDLRHSVSG